MSHKILILWYRTSSELIIKATIYGIINMLGIILDILNILSLIQ